MTSREIAWKIYEELKARGLEIGNASVGIIEQVLDECDFDTTNRCFYCGTITDECGICNNCDGA